MEKAIVKRLLMNLFLANKVAGRVFPDRIPQDSPSPCLCYTSTENNPAYTQGGAVINQAKFDIMAFSTKKAEAVEMGDVIKDQLHLWHGTLEGITIEAIYFVGSRDDFDEETKEFIRIISFNVS